MAKNLLVTIVWQLFWSSVIFLAVHFGIRVVRDVVPKVGHDERLFPRDIIHNNDALNRHRVQIADGVLDYLMGKKVTLKSANVEIRVVTSNRGNDFLYQTVLFLLEQQLVLFNCTLSICNVEAEIFPDLRRFDRLNLPITTIGDKSRSSRGNLNSTISKENQDYWKCLEVPTESRYILLIEDDAVVIPEFSKLLKSLVQKLDNHQYIDFVKLYHPNYLRKFPAYALYAFVSITISYFSCHFINRFFKNFPILTFLILSLALFWDLTSYGSQLSADIRYYISRSAYISYPESCCTPAVIFRQSSVKSMVEYFSKTMAYSGHAKDHILDESPFTGRQSDLNYVTHIGSFSSVRQRNVFLSDLREI